MELSKDDLVVISDGNRDYIGTLDSASIEDVILLNDAFIIIEIPLPAPDGGGIQRLQFISPIVPSENEPSTIQVRYSSLIKISESMEIASTYRKTKASCSNIQLATDSDVVNLKSNIIL